MSSNDERRGVVFDLDGVLVDSSEPHLRAIERLGESFGVRVTEQFHKDTFGMRADETIRALLPDVSDTRLHELVCRKEAIYRELARGHLAALPGAVELVRALDADGFALAVGSSTVRANVELALDETGLSGAFQALVAGEDVERGKPAPDVFVVAANKLALSPSRCLVIEDAVHGVEAARAAEMSVIAVTTSQPRDRLVAADFVVDSLAELTPATVAEIIG